MSNNMQATQLPDMLTWWSEKILQTVGMAALACLALRIPGSDALMQSLSPFRFGGVVALGGFAYATLMVLSDSLLPFEAAMATAVAVVMSAGCLYKVTNASGTNTRKMVPSSGGKNNACVLAVGTALPPHELSMDLAAETWEDHIAPHMGVSADVTTWVKRRILGSAIEKRWTVCPKLHEQFAGKAPGLYGDAPNKNPTAEPRNDVWIEEATKLAIQSATAAMNNFKGSKEDITHVLFHSCTGFKAPGIELDIVQELGLPNVQNRFGVNFMGCFGGFTILKAAKYICDAEPGSHVLCVCSELCTLHQGSEDHRSAQMGIALFGDASASVVVGPGNTGDWALTQNRSVTLPKASKGSMTWRATDYAYRMWLDKTIPESIGNALYWGWKSWFEHAMGMSDPALAEWAVHPGGKLILDAVSDPRVGIKGPSGKVEPEHLRHSYAVLREVGNVSSCSILFVLQRVLKDTQRDSIFMLGFGPGLTVEYTGLRKIARPDHTEE